MQSRPRPTPGDAWLTAPRQNLPFDYKRADLRVRDPEVLSKPRPWASKQIRPPESQQPITCVLMRGGTSKGLFFLARDLPPVQKLRDRILLAALGSPDPRQINGCGGGDSLTSKVAIMAPSPDPDHDIDYLFAQVSVDQAVVDTTPSCGNILAAVACYAIEEGLVVTESPCTKVRIQAVNNKAHVEAIVQTPNGRLTYEGDTVIDGVPGSGAPIILNFRNIIGARTGKMLPSGSVLDTIEGIPATCLDVAMPMVIFRAEDLEVPGDAPPSFYNNDKNFLNKLERLRRQAGLLMGLGDVAGQVTPKVALISPAKNGGTFTSRYFVPEKCHATHAVTGAIGAAAGSILPGSIFQSILTAPARGPLRVEVEHPVGRIPVNLEFSKSESGWLTIERAGVISTARRLFEGRVLVPAHLLWP